MGRQLLGNDHGPERNRFIPVTCRRNFFPYIGSEKRRHPASGEEKETAVLATEYSTTEFALWLLVAALVGFVIGWLIRNWWLDRQKADEIAAIRAEEAEKLKKAEAERDGWQAKTAGLTADLDRKGADVDRALAQVSERDKTIEQLESDLSDGRSSLAKLESAVEDRESTIAALRADAGKEETQLASLRADLDAANATIGTLRSDADGYKGTIDSLRTDLDGARRRQAKTEEKLNATSSRAREAEEALAAAQSGASGADEELGDLRAQIEAAEGDRDALAARLAELESEHADCAERIAAAESGAPPADLPDKDVAVAKVAEIAARTRGTGPTVEDDLKKIHGVGPKLENLLKSMDITSFKQVANFTADDIQYVTAALEAFPGRIERDDWMSSAAEEHSKKYGESA